jgi:hypothetical protein
MIDRDTIIDLVALVDTEFMQLKVGTYNGFDIYERFALYIEAKVRAEEREACAKLCDEQANNLWQKNCDSEGHGADQCAVAIRARGEK